MRHGSVELHNVATAREASGGDGTILQRVPEDVRERLNEDARERMLRPAGAEIRFVCDGPRVEVTLSCPDGRCEVHPYWGPFRGAERVVAGGPRTVELRYPEDVAALDPDVAADLRYDPEVWRLALHGDPVSLHGVRAEGIRPPDADEVPDRRYLAYGTSITEGQAATGPHLTYVGQAARRLGADPLNLGSGGSAYCERAMAEYIAGREDWDVATLALSVNMLGAGFSLETFRERAAAMVDTVADTGRPVLAITIFPFTHDVSSACRYPDARAGPAAFREALREVVTATPHPNVHLLEGPELLDDVGGLSPDLTHPSDHGMIRIGERLARRLAPLF